MKIAVYPGSFDPITLGHLNVIERAAKLFDQVIVCVMVNSQKHYMFSEEERVGFIRRVTRHLPKVEADSASGLLADYARRRHADVVIKGLRAVTDFENEFMMAMINHKLNDQLDTMFLMAEQKYLYLSSSTVKELGRYGADLTDFLPEQIIPDFSERIQLRRNQNG